MECAEVTCCSASAVSSGKPTTTPSATITSETRSPRAGRFSLKHSSRQSASSAGDGGAGDGQEDRIELHHRHARRRQRAAEDQHAEQSVDPSARRLVHAALLRSVAPVSAERLALPETVQYSLAKLLWYRRAVQMTTSEHWRCRRHACRDGHGGDPAAHRRPQPDAGRTSCRRSAAFAATMQVSTRPSSKPMSGWPPKA